MKLSFLQLFMVLAACTYTYGNLLHAQELLLRKVTIQSGPKEIREILNELEDLAQVKFVYSLQTLPVGRKVTVSVRDKAVSEVLNTLFYPDNVSYKIVRNKIVLRLVREQPAGKTPASGEAEVLLDRMSPERVLSGRVTDAGNEPLPGVSVTLKGTARGTITDAAGRFSIEVPDDQAVLVFSFVGYVSQEKTVGSATRLEIALATDVRSLSEVVVVGYGTQKRSDVSSAVSSVQEEDFKAQPVNRLDQVLQGRVSGVQVTNAGGAPGGDVRVRIRGANSLSGDNDPLYVVDGYVGADFTTLNTEDIASIEVLKDAAATAIYGNRGANGVIIVTTKKGQKGDMQVDFGVRYYLSEVIKKYNTLNAADFAETVNERTRALLPPGGTYVPRFTDAEIEAFRRNGGTDWQDEIFRVAGGKEFQLGLSGGNEKTSYLVSSNFLQQDGIIRNTDFKRYSIRANITSRLSDKLSFRLNFTGSRKENHNTGGTSQRSGALAQALAWAPTTPVRDANGNYILFDPTSSLFSNPVAIVYENEYRAENTNFNLIGGLRYEFIPGLSLDVQAGLNYLNSQGKAFEGYPSTRTWANAGRSSGENITWQNTNTLHYNRKLGGGHQLDVTAVFETQKFTGTGFNVNVSNLTYPSQTYNNLALSASNLIGSGYSEWSLLSLLGRVNYSFQDRYLVSATLRRDGSSKFRGKNKFGTFPSVSVGWKLSEEAFMKGQDVFRNLKVRGSWGLTGNQGIGPFGTLSAYVTNLDDAGVVFNGKGGPLVAGILMGNPGNPDLKWETTEQVNIGTDFDLFNGKLSFSLDYFVKNTRDLLMLRALPGYVGGYNIQSNIGEVQNKGWELTVRADPFTRTDFQWNASLNAAVLANKVVSLGAERDTIPLNMNVLIPGYSMNSFWGYGYLGTWKPAQADEAARYGLKPGDARYEDVNGDGVINERDQKVIGNGTPRFSLGLNNTFTYKNLSLNVFFQGLFGFKKLNYTYANGMIGSTDAKEVILADIKNRYIPGVNETSDIPAFSPASDNSLIKTSRFIEDGDFLRLKNLSLAYAFPKSRLGGIAAVRLFISATNLLTFTRYKGIDPEANSNAVSGLTWDNFGTDVQQGVDFGAYPNSKTYTAGINFSF